ncbi:MAG TPA: hypothetical protein VEQ16_00215, partial [Acidocella sp.]|nr:hypothetical protein [Acidocella sp.]
METLEDRLQLGETVLGVLTGLTLLESLAPAPELSELPALVSPRPLPVTSPGLLDSYSAAAPQSGAIYEIVNHADSPNPTPGGDTADFWPSAGQASPAFWRASGPLGAARQDPFFLSMVPFTGSAGPAAFSAPVQAFPPTFSRTDAPGALRDSASGTDFATLTDSTPLAFDIGTGQLGIHRDANDHTVRTTINAAGFLEVTRAGQLHSSDPASAGFDRALAGAMAANLRAVRFDGGAEDQLAVSASCLPGAFVVRAGAAEVIAGAVTAAGAVSIQAPKVTVTGAVHAPAVSLNATGWVVIEATGEVSTGRDGTGGQIAIVADKFVNSGRVHADGAAGGQIQLHAGNILNGGPISADGTQSGPGGSVQVSFTGVYIGTVAGLTSANSQPEPGASAPGVGGTVIINGGATGRLFSSGKHEATGATGGEVDLLGREIVLPGASIDTSGNNGGGLVHIGGDFHGGTVGASLQLARSQGQVTNLPHNASTVTVTSATTIHADAWQNGDGGRVAVWSEEGTDFSGTASARGGITGGAGGFIEVSSKGKLNFAGSGDAGAPRGQAGKL